jgi:hypothetical protein
MEKEKERKREREFERDYVLIFLPFFVLCWTQNKRETIRD